MLAGSLAVANGANVIRTDLYNLRFGTCMRCRSVISSVVGVTSDAQVPLRHTEWDILSAGNDVTNFDVTSDAQVLLRHTEWDILSAGNDVTNFGCLS